MLFALYFCFFTSVIIQLYLHFTLFKKHNIMQDKIVYTLHHFPEVTILICAKNEARNLKQNLPLILEQDYPKDKFKVLVVNDMSDDDTNIILDELSATYKHLHVIETQKKDRKSTRLNSSHVKISY